MRILTGFIAPTSGSARIDGREVLEDPIGCRRKIGYLPEGNPLYTELRLEEALRFVAEMFGLAGAERDRAIRESIEAAGLGEVERRVIGTLSKGYRQRVGLAQALMHRPEILILDEPTSGLDPNQQEDMRGLIRALGRERTVILSTHVLPEVEAVCDRALIISAGRLVADGTVEAIKAQAAGGARAVAVVRGDPEAARAAFVDLPFARAVESEPIPESPGLSRVRIAVEGALTAERMEAVAARAVTRALPLSRLEAATATLEQIFSQLTEGDAAEASVAAGAPSRGGE
jgi:ABC-2 type transport system ATP-binding protein